MARRDDPPIPTLGEISRSPGWAWAYCNKRNCSHRMPMPFAPYVIRWGANVSSDVLLRNLKCCGRRGGSLSAPSSVTNHFRSAGDRTGLPPIEVLQARSRWACALNPWRSVPLARWFWASCNRLSCTHRRGCRSCLLRSGGARTRRAMCSGEICAARSAATRLGSSRPHVRTPGHRRHSVRGPGQSRRTKGKVIVQVYLLACRSNDLHHLGGIQYRSQPRVD